MGKAIEQAAVERGHTIVAKLNATPAANDLADADVAIEFSGPDTAFKNIKSCLEHTVPVVCGSTGWLEKKSEADALAEKSGSAFLYGSNFSIGVNLFFELNKKLAALMAPQSEYTCQMEEIHHIHKKDAPSGTAISLAEDILNESSYTAWKLDATEGETLGIYAVREDEVPGTHSVRYTSEADEIEIKHTAYTRKGFALGAVIAAEWIEGKKGVFTMKDVLGL